MSVSSLTFFLYPKNYGTGKPLHGERGGYPLHPHCNSATLPPGTRGGKPRWGQLGCVEYPGMVDDTATGPPSRNRNLRSVSVPGPPLWQLSPTVSLVPLSHLCHAVAPAPSPGHRPLAAPRPAKGAPRPSPRGRAPAPGAAPPAAPWRAHRPRPTRAWTGGVGTPGSRGSRNRERTANLAVFGPPWAGGGPAYPLPPPVRSPPLNPVSPVFARVYRLATGAGKRTATRARGGFLTACDYVLSVLLPPTMVLALRLGFASGVVLSSLRTYQQTNPLPSY